MWGGLMVYDMGMEYTIATFLASFTLVDIGQYFWAAWNMFTSIKPMPFVTDKKPPPDIAGSKTKKRNLSQRKMTMNYCKTEQSDQSIKYEELENTVQFLRRSTKIRPTLAIVCGSGLGGLADSIEDKEILSYKEIPNFPTSTVAGHAGYLVFGKLSGKQVVCMKGRIHLYEGYSMAKITFPIRVMIKLGAKLIIITNASGGLNPEFEAGDIMIIKDHINLPGLSGSNPLIGVDDDRFGPRFLSLSDAYEKRYRELAKNVANRLGMNNVKEGVYVIQSGPCFETVSEAGLLRMLGADVAGMSSVPEVIVARHMGASVLGISLVANKCVLNYDANFVVTHEDVLKTMEVRAKEMERFIMKFVEEV